MDWCWTSANLSSSINVPWLDLDLPIHHSQPLNLITAVAIVFLLMRAISQVVSASWARSGPRWLWQSCSVKVSPPVLSPFVSSLAVTCGLQQILRTRWKKRNRSRKTEEDRPQRQPVLLKGCMNGFFLRYSLWSLSPALCSSKGWQSLGLAWVWACIVPSKSSQGHTDVLIITQRHQRWEKRSRGFLLFRIPLSHWKVLQTGLKSGTTGDTPEIFPSLFCSLWCCVYRRIWVLKGPRGLASLWPHRVA